LGDGSEGGVELDEGKIVPSSFGISDGLGEDLLTREGGEGGAVRHGALGEGDVEGVGGEIRVGLLRWWGAGVVFED
jgi:hypothetical protein